MAEVLFAPKLYPMDVGEPVVEDVEILHLEDLGTDSFYFGVGNDMS